MSRVLNEKPGAPYLRGHDQRERPVALKQKQTRWFELYTPRDVTVYAIEALAKTGTVELYQNIWSKSSAKNEHINLKLDDINKLEKRLKSDLPKRLLAPQSEDKSPEKLADESLSTLRNWAATLLKLQRRLRKVNQQIDDLELLNDLLVAIPGHDLDFNWVVHPSELLYKKLFTCPHGEITQAPGEAFFVDVFPGKKQDFVLVLGIPEHSGVIKAIPALTDCREIVIPSWLGKTSIHSLTHIEAKRELLEKERDALTQKLAAHKDDSDVKSALASARLLGWYFEHLKPARNQENKCHIMGWTSADSPHQLEDALAQAGIETEVIFAENPVAQIPPVERRHSSWVQPFGIFVDLAGAPGNNEVDPTPLLAIIVPLLFGYMFPDVGHGLILVVAGFLLSRKFTQTRVLIPCGIAAMGFGLLFGDVFGQHDIMDPLWIKPLENPLAVLTIPLIFGAFLLTLGLLFSGFEAYWRGEFGQWLLVDASILLLYLVLLSGLLRPDVLWITPIFLLWYFIGNLIRCRGNMVACLSAAVAHLFDSILRLTLNSISFIRVGAFALAHSGTSHAANLMIDMIDNTAAVVVVFILSHAFIIVLEGLIVFVQTTRLILFEFFIRFLKADGRVFKPLQGVDQ